ncbi:MAG: transposase [Nitrososphaerota archaeon]|jgi:transposase|nr:transposase [Nitrososphaerota archaeon]MDG7040245.1 transposase [Nitrososphaerota archaeon]MDG7043447.1 transposase [Nitrososphaerota archaeon]MDG7046865.1 transposase [Nitrososphaerota archaeon]MDG7048200.1 transposase [Nitrososphaerota archaeon]
MTHPDWVLKQKRKGTLIMKRGDRYYLYKVTSKWNPEKKRAQLKTGEYLGRITPEGIMEPKAKMVMKRFENVSVKEYGASFLLYYISSDIMDYLKSAFPEWKEIFTFACMRLIHNSPLKNVEFHYTTSFLSELISARVSPESLSEMLRNIGTDRKAMVDFMKKFIKDEKYLAVDLTHILSMSDSVISATLGHNSMEVYLPQVQLLFLFSLDHGVPVYFRITPGSVTCIMSLSIAMQESGVKNALVVADTGFYSARNIAGLEGMGLFYIIPLKRNSKLINYSLQQKSYFMFEGKPIFYAKYRINSRTIYTFRNDFLRAEEERDYLSGHKSLSKLWERTGTISVITNLNETAEKTFSLLKSRADIDQSYDTFKNTIHADRTYIRDDYQLHGWTFINFVALILHYRIYGLLKQRDLLRGHSPEDVIEHLERISMLEIGDEWKLSEISKKSREIVDALEIPIMQNGGS